MSKQSQEIYSADEVDRQIRLRSNCPSDHPDFDRVVRTVWRLRQIDGCPWDKEQTHKSLTKNMIEEAYEVVDAINAEDDMHLLEELGDVLEQVLLHAQIAADGGLAGESDGIFDIDTICRKLNEKLIRRHPHIFAEHAKKGAALNTDDVLDIWDAVKANERDEKEGNTGQKPGLLDSVPNSLPALMQCQKISKRAAKVGFEWTNLGEVWEKVAEERAEYEAEEPGTPEAAMEFGDLLFALVNVARKQGIDAEEALAASNRKFRQRWSFIEERACTQDHAEISELGTERLNELWDLAKADEHNKPKPLAK